MDVKYQSSFISQHSIHHPQKELATWLLKRWHGKYIGIDWLEQSSATRAIWKAVCHHERQPLAVSEKLPNKGLPQSLPRFPCGSLQRTPTCQFREKLQHVVTHVLFKIDANLRLRVNPPKVPKSRKGNHENCCIMSWTSLDLLSHGCYMLPFHQLEWLLAQTTSSSISWWSPLFSECALT